MKKKFNLLMGIMLLGGTCATQAQIEYYDDEISVTDEQGHEEVIDVPEALTYEMDSLLNLYSSKNYLVQDTSCTWRSVDPEFSREVYVERLSKMPTVMEMPYNDVVRKFIDRYSQRMRRGVSVMLGASNFYMPIFEQALEAYNLPLELKYLPVIESGLNPTAVSRVGATGLWQFMLATGKRYGLQVNSLVDERRDPIRSSYAAAQYLRDLYKIFGDWNLVIAAYNCGPENINRAIRRAGGSTDYWKIYPYLPRETRGYVPAFIAANYIMNYYCEHGICPMVTNLPARTDTVMVSRDVHLQQIAAICDLDIKELRELNPQYRRDIVNGNSEPSAIRLPITAINTFIDNEEAIYNYNAAELLTKRTEVEVADAQPDPTPRQQRNYSSQRTYYQPSGRHHAQQQPRESYGRHGRNSRGKGVQEAQQPSRSRRGHQQAQVNSHTSRGGKQATRQQAAKGKTAARGKKAAASQDVTVKKGETLSQIARKHGTTVDKLRKSNGIKGDKIREGQKLKVK